MSEGVRLVLLAEEHLDDVAALLEDPEVLRFTRVPDPPAPDFARRWLERYEEGRLDGTREAFAALDDSGRFLGLALAPEIDRAAREVELGYIVAPAARGRGVATGMLAELTLGVRRGGGVAHLPHRRRRERGVLARRRALRVRARGRDALDPPQGRCSGRCGVVVTAAV